MARPLSDEKRSAILLAAAQVIAEHGTGGPISKIAKQAGVAEGTIFTYFDDKDALLNALYLALKADLAVAFRHGRPASKTLKARVQHAWERYIQWGATHPAQRRAMSQLSVSDRITDDTRQLGAKAFEEIGATLDEVVTTGNLKGQSPLFVAAIMESIAETTLSFIAREPDAADNYTRAGFDAFWNAVSKS
ncbi:TetR/AcrR family transcriptional regulator [Paraburkholderia sp.]|uniref:TetR/AcrR family transcriptional regulator n=1 Tax=Paraburkholderia sp. TaxID=1926495 RepID=UPI0023959148|nr:TetR/AcrR family transcriptional regulator [Paraburkholderia sp.]MDE1179275.1 TetR/AcrR family transcriptional regulator [Paraburkholderia sp.]